jgi:hypothetical protein
VHALTSIKALRVLAMRSDETEGRRRGKPRYDHGRCAVGGADRLRVRFISLTAKRILPVVEVGRSRSDDPVSGREAIARRLAED